MELQLLDSTTRVPGQTLTGVEKRYRTQWIAAMHAVMQHVSLVLMSVVCIAVLLYSVSVRCSTKLFFWLDAVLEFFRKKCTFQIKPLLNVYNSRILLQ